MRTHALIERVRGLSVLVAVVVCPMDATFGQFRIFVEISGVSGPATFQKHEGALEALEYFEQLSAPVDPGDPRPEGAAPRRRISLEAQVSQVSPFFAEAVSEGEPIESVVFYFYRFGPEPEEFYRVTLEDVFVVSVDLTATSRGEIPVEVVALDFHPGKPIQLRYLRGDTDGDLDHDVSDVTALLDYLFQGRDLGCPFAAEVNGDGFIDVSDPIYLLLYLFAGGNQPPSPFPSCGMLPIDRSFPCDHSPCNP